MRKDEEEALAHDAEARRLAGAPGSVAGGAAGPLEGLAGWGKPPRAQPSRPRPGAS